MSKGSPGRNPSSNKNNKSISKDGEKQAIIREIVIKTN